MKLKVNGVTLNVVVEGDVQAPPVLLLHGFPDSSKLWNGQVPIPIPLHFSALQRQTIGVWKRSVSKMFLAGCRNMKVELQRQIHRYMCMPTKLVHAFLQIKPLVGAGYRVIVPDLR